jgi:hypothetical protein
MFLEVRMLPLRWKGPEDDVNASHPDFTGTDKFAVQSEDTANLVFWEGSCATPSAR